MLFGEMAKIRVFIYQKPIDFRCGFEKLSFFVREHLKADILEGDMYLFLGNNRKRAKVLLFDRTGLIMLTKRLEGGKLMALMDLENASEITTSELSLILSGARIRLPKPKAHKPETTRVADQNSTRVAAWAHV